MRYGDSQEIAEIKKGRYTHYLNVYSTFMYKKQFNRVRDLIQVGIKIQGKNVDDSHIH